MFASQSGGRIAQEVAEMACEWVRSAVAPQLRPHGLFIRADDVSTRRRLGTHPVYSLGRACVEFCSPEYVWPGTSVQADLVGSEAGAPQRFEGIVRECRQCRGHGAYRVSIALTRHIGNCGLWLLGLRERRTARSDECPERAGAFCAGCSARRS
jgi:hypothetical protein